MTGWRVAFACGNAEAIKALATVKSNIDSGVFTAVQDAAIEALAGPQDEIDALCAIYQRRRDLVMGALGKIGYPRGDSQGHHLHLGEGAGGLHLGRIRHPHARDGRTSSCRPAPRTDPTARDTSVSPSRRRTTASKKRSRASRRRCRAGERAVPDRAAARTAHAQRTGRGSRRARRHRPRSMTGLSRSRSPNWRDWPRPAGAVVVATLTQRLKTARPPHVHRQGQARGGGVRRRPPRARTWSSSTTSSRRRSRPTSRTPCPRSRWSTAPRSSSTSSRCMRPRREGKLQVELAQMEYLLPRLRGMWRHLEAALARRASGRAAPGESQLETDRRIARKRIAELQAASCEHVAGEREPAAQGAARAAACSGCRSSATRTRASRRRSTRSRTPTRSSPTSCSRPWTPPRARSSCRKAGRSRSPTRSGSSTSCRTASWRRSSRPSTRYARPTCSSMSSTRCTRKRANRWPPCPEVLGEIGAADRPALLVFNKADLIDDRRA